MVLADLLIHIRLGHLQVVDGVVDDAERITQLVADAAGQLAQHGEFFLADQFFLGLGQFARAGGHFGGQTGIVIPQGFLGLLLHADILGDNLYSHHRMLIVKKRLVRGKDPFCSRRHAKFRFKNFRHAGSQDAAHALIHNGTLFRTKNLQGGFAKRIRRHGQFLGPTVLQDNAAILVKDGVGRAGIFEDQLIPGFALL